VCLALNVIGNLILVRYLEHVGITLSTALTGWFNTLLLVVFSYRKKIFAFDQMIKTKFLKICLSCACLYIALEALVGLIGKHVYGSSSLLSIASFGGIVLIGTVVYLCALGATRTYSLSELKRLL
jgi:peptidoglycan biosynthesis protein MviN/MurJ (putative lipid II flippase)